VEEGPGAGREEECLFWLVRGLRERFAGEGEGHWSLALGEKLLKGKGKKGVWGGWGEKGEL
jgi:hypothetical protein